MKYLNSKEIMMFLEPPITRLSVFEVESVDAALTMCADVFPKIEVMFHVQIDFPTFKYQLLKTLGEFLSRCANSEEHCLENTRKRVDKQQYERKHIDISLWPKRMQKTTAENFFLMDYTLTYADILFRYLLDSGVKEEAAHHLASDALQKLAQWIDLNCIQKCDYDCIRRSSSSGYCTLCSYMIQPLACPKKQEVSYHNLRLDEHEIQCKRGQFTK